MNIRTTAYLLVIGIALVIILIYGKSLLIPFVFALLLWFMVREIKSQLNRVAIIKKHVPSWLKTVLSAGTILVFFGLISGLISSNIKILAESYPKYEKNVDYLINEVNQTFGIDILQVVRVQAGDFNFGEILASIFNSITDILGSAFMILVYVIFMFLEEAHFQRKLKKVFPNEERFGMVSEILGKTEVSISKYITLKAFVSLVTGVLSYIVLLIIGIDSPFFWAFFIFLLNFIPIIGSLIATLFPAFFCLLQFGEFGPGFLVLLIVGAIQLAVGNFLEPKLMGNSMNLSALVTIAALTFWGAIWGITGMILSIPITVIIVIVFSHMPSLRPVAIMLSEKGRV